MFYHSIFSCEQNLDGEEEQWEQELGRLDESDEDGAEGRQELVKQWENIVGDSASNVNLLKQSCERN